MDTGRFRIGMAVAVLAIALMVPAVAVAAALQSGWIVERGLVGGGIFEAVTRTSPDVSGHWAIYAQKGVLPDPPPASLVRVDLRTGVRSIVATDSEHDLRTPEVDGDWAAYECGAHIFVKNLATGVRKQVTNADLLSDFDPAISGKYVVWNSVDGLNVDVWAKDFTGTKAKFLIAGGAGMQSEQAISGTRVVYTDGGLSTRRVYVKTIGSSASPKLLDTQAGTALGEIQPSIGDHLVAWRYHNGSRWAIRYYNYDTDQILEGPGSTLSDMENPQVSGDRISVNASNGADQDIYVYDARVSRSAGIAFAFITPTTAGDQVSARLSGTSMLYLSGGYPVWGKMLAPSLSIGSVPSRVARHGHIHLKGTLSDLGVPIAAAPLRIEKYSGGKWLLAKTLTTSSSGTYSYQTPTLHSKTSYRVAYDGARMVNSSRMQQHLSAVSAVRVGWPR